MNQIIQLLATRTSNAVADAHARGRISDARLDALSRSMAGLAGQLDRGEINANEYKGAMTSIAAGVGA